MSNLGECDQGVTAKFRNSRNIVNALLGRVNWSVVNRATRREVRNREVHCPPISLFRWWARRPHALARSLLKASNLKRQDLVSDPFSGGGTVTLEAVTRGYRVYAQDLNPWPTWGLQTALDGVPPDLLQKAIESFWEKLRGLVARHYVANCPLHGSGEILHTFWVRQCTCGHCKRTLYLYPYSLITLASRHQSEKVALYGCSGCGHITGGGIIRRVSCGHCGRRLAPAREPLFAHKLVRCPQCAKDVAYRRAWSHRPRWKPVLVQRYCTHQGRRIVHFAVPTARDVAAAFLRVKLPRPLLDDIPSGQETSVLRRGGFRHWRDLYPPRQLAVLLRAAQLAQTLKWDTRVRGRIQLAIAGAGEMAGYLCRWDRFHPKAFEALANHRFAVLGLAVETNLAAARGRGTLKRRLMNSLKAARWAHERIKARCSQASYAPNGHDAVASKVVTGSSTRQLIPSNSVRLVITDPPYYDAVQYGELSALFLTWARVVTGRKRGWRPNLHLEAVPNGTRKVGATHYERVLRSIFKETARTMRSDGRLLLTYHSTDFRGWAALGRALREARLRVMALAVVHSENEKDHPKRNRNAFSKDLVIECHKGRKGVKTPIVVTPVRESDQRELVAAGLTIVRLGEAQYEEMAREFLRLTRRLKCRRIRVPNLRPG